MGVGRSRRALSASATAGGVGAADSVGRFETRGLAKPRYSTTIFAGFMGRHGRCRSARRKFAGARRWIVRATRIVGDARLAAILAALDMTAERWRSAADRGHDLALVVGQPVALGSAKSVAVAAENIRHLQLLRAHDPASFGRDHHEREPVERTWRVGDQMSGDLHITGGRRKVGMSEQHLDDAESTPLSRRSSRSCGASYQPSPACSASSCVLRPTSLLQCGDADV